MKRGDPQMRIRMPVDVDRWLEQQAELNVRTKNAELVFIVKQAMGRRRDKDGSTRPRP